ncbi:hypothetical protein [Bacillus sp. OAE603]|uniref:hypothetical protein n=1 Tax=Gottfriedia sp. OAE603 TaxID=2663872 RepID=UPI00178B4077
MNITTQIGIRSSITIENENVSKPFGEINVQPSPAIDQLTIEESVTKSVLHDIKGMETYLLKYTTTNDLTVDTTNLVVKHAYLRDQILRHFEGDEQTKRLDKLEQILTKRISSISESKAEYMGNLLNLQSDNLYEDGYVCEALNGSIEAYVEEEKKKQSGEIVVDKNDLKTKIAQGIRDQIASFQNVIETNQKEWQKVLETGGAGMDPFYQTVLDNIKSKSTPSNSIEDLGFNEINTLSEALDTMRKGIYIVGSADQVLAYLGFAKAKLNVFLEHKEMPDFLRNTIREKMNEAATIKKKSVLEGESLWQSLRSWSIENSARERNGMPKLSIDDLRINQTDTQKADTKKMLAFQQAFEDLGNVKSALFSQTFLALLDSFNDYLSNKYKQVDPGPEPIERAKRARQHAKESMINDWNAFAEKLFSSNEQLKKDYTVQVNPGDKIDRTV